MAAFGNLLQRLSDNVDKVCRVFLLIVMAVMVTTVLGQVFFRYVLNAALSWPEELTIFLMAWMTFVGSGIALKGWEHIGITIFAGMLPENLQAALAVLVKIAVLFFAVFLTYTGVVLVQKSTHIISEALRISVVWPRLSVPVGGIIMTIHTVNLLYQNVYSLIRKGANN